MNKQLVFLENKYTLPRFDYEYFADISGRKVLVYPIEELEQVKLFLDNFDYSVGVPSFTRYGMVSIFYYEKLREALREICSTVQQTVLMSVFEFYNELLGQLRDDLQLSGIGAKAMGKYRDKSLMQALIEKNPNIKLPQAIIFDRQKGQANLEGYFEQLVVQVGLPMIIKPVDGASSVDVYLIESKAQFLDLKLDPQSSFLVQQFINSKLFHIDFAIYRGTMVFLDACQLSVPQMEIKKMPKYLFAGLPVEEPALKAKIREFTQQVITSLECEDSCYHMEAFLDDNHELIFLEIAARPGGGGISKMYKTMYGIGLSKLHACILSDSLPKIKDYSQTKSRNALWMECATGFDISVLNLQGELDEFITPISHVLIISSPEQEVIARDFNKIVDYSLEIINSVKNYSGNPLANES